MQEMILNNNVVGTIQNRPIMANVDTKTPLKQDENGIIAHLKRRNNALQNIADKLRTTNKQERLYMFRRLKQTNPNINLKAFCREYMSNEFEAEGEQVDNWFGSKLIKKIKRSSRKFKKYVKKTGKKVGKRIKSVAKKVARGLLAVQLAPLLPLKGVMVRAIKSKTGKNMRRSSILNVTKTFYNKVVKSGSHFDEFSENDVQQIDILNNFDTLEDFEEVHGKDHVAPAVIMSIISAVLSFIKMMKKKKDESKKTNKPVTSQVSQIANGVTKVMQEIEKGTSTAQIVYKTGADPKPDIREQKRILKYRKIGDKPRNPPINKQYLYVGAGALLLLLLHKKVI